MKSGRGVSTARWFGRVRLVVLVGLAAGLSAGGSRRSIDGARLIEDIRYLSSPALNGRGSGTPELEKAATYIARQFAAAGLEPMGDVGYLQPFEISRGAALGTSNRLLIREGGTSAPLDRESFLPLNFSGTGQASGGLVFAGYGISAPECDYDDYAGIDARGKVVVILRHEPQEHDAASPFEGRVYSEHSQLLSKALNARAHGARAILFVNDMAAHSGTDTFEPFHGLPSPGDPGIPFVQVKAEVVEGWFRSLGKDLTALQAGIDRDLTPHSFEFPNNLGVELEVDIQRESRKIHNVLGYLPGRTAEYVVVGAHYDHLGLGEQYSMAPNTAGAVHPGADDNASGTAGVLAIARLLASQPKAERGALFIAFAGEEIGLLGSTHYINHPRLPLERAVAMINMDMIGRMQGNRIIAGGAASGEGLRTLLEEISKRRNIEVDTSERAVYGSSDHTAFKARMVPVLFFFTGLHGDYHRPSDTWDKIEARSTIALVDLVADVADRLRRQGGRPQFVGISNGRTSTNTGNVQKSSHSTPAGSR